MKTVTCNPLSLLDFSELLTFICLLFFILQHIDTKHAQIISTDTTFGSNNSCLEPFVKELKGLVDCHPFNKTRERGMCKRFVVQLNSTESVAGDYNVSFGIYEYLGIRPDCPKCLGVYGQKRKDRVCLFHYFGDPALGFPDNSFIGWTLGVLAKEETFQWEEFWEIWTIACDLMTCKKYMIDDPSHTKWEFVGENRPSNNGKTIKVICVQERIISDWVKEGNCSANETSGRTCGKESGFQKETRTCKDGNIEFCDKVKIEQAVPCDIECPSTTKIETEAASESLEIQSSSTASTFTKSEKDQPIENSQKTAESAYKLTSSTVFLANVVSSAIDEDEEKSCGNNVETSFVFIFPFLSISVYLNLFRYFPIQKAMIEQ